MLNLFAANFYYYYYFFEAKSNRNLCCNSFGMRK